MQRHRSDVSGVILKGTLASYQHRNRTLKPMQKFRKSRNFALCLIDDFVFSKLFYTLFFVAILLIFNQFYKVTKYSAEKATEGLVQHRIFFPECFCSFLNHIFNIYLYKRENFSQTSLKEVILRRQFRTLTFPTYLSFFQRLNLTPFPPVGCQDFSGSVPSVFLNKYDSNL